MDTETAITHNFAIMDRKTIFSPCRFYRYTLWRQWDMYAPEYAMFICLNPSTADEIVDDPTVRRCIAFAKTWGYGALCMMNIFAFRATRPWNMKAASDPVGPFNDHYLTMMAKQASLIIAAWGVHGTHLGRDLEMIKMFPDLKCLGTTKDGQPRHPLYLKKEVEPIPYREAQELKICR